MTGGSPGQPLSSGGHPRAGPPTVYLMRGRLGSGEQRRARGEWLRTCREPAESPNSGGSRQIWSDGRARWARGGHDRPMPASILAGGSQRQCRATCSGRRPAAVRRANYELRRRLSRRSGLGAEDGLAVVEPRHSPAVVFLGFFRERFGTAGGPAEFAPKISEQFQPPTAAQRQPVKNRCEFGGNRAAFVFPVRNHLPKTYAAIAA